MPSQGKNRTTVTIFRFAKSSFLATLGFVAESRWDSLFRVLSRPFQLQEQSLAPDAAAVATEPAIFADDAVARD